MPPGYGHGNMYGGYGNQGMYGGRGNYGGQGGMRHTWPSGRNSQSSRGQVPNSRGQMRGQMGQARGQMPQMSQMGQMPQMGQMGHQMGQMQGQNGQMGQQRMATPEEMGIRFESADSIFGTAGQGAQPQNQPRPQPQAQRPPQQTQMQQTQMQPQSQLQTQAQPPQTTPPTPASTDTLGEFIQNERNTALFYEHLAAISPTDDARGKLLEAASHSRKACALIQRLYRNSRGQDFATRDTQVNTSVGYRGGIKWALHEEGNALRELAAVFEGLGNEGAGALMPAFAYKIGNVGTLLSISN